MQGGSKLVENTANSLLSAAIFTLFSLPSCTNLLEQHQQGHRAPCCCSIWKSRTSCKLFRGYGSSDTLFARASRIAQTLSSASESPDSIISEAVFSSTTCNFVRSFVHWRSTDHRDKGIAWLTRDPVTATDVRW